MKKRIGVVYGGYSGEAEVSRKSASMILNNIDRNKYEPVEILVERNGIRAHVKDGFSKVDLNDFSYKDGSERIKPDLCLIIVHGTPGEDGKLQGYFDMIGMPYTTGSVMNTSLTFSKAFTNNLLKYFGYNSAQGVYLQSMHPGHVAEIEQKLRYPVIVKPNEGGSSLGISLVREHKDLEPALKQAFELDRAVLIEEYIEGSEYSCGVVNTEEGLKALAITEIRTQKPFFDYKAKYEYDQTEEITPADMPEYLYKKCQEISKEIYAHFNCSGVARIDYRLRGEDFYVIEINTVPGLSEKSIVPQQAEAIGISKKELVTMMIESVSLKDKR
jgi:D-alanine-D-alanine ligase